MEVYIQHRDVKQPSFIGGTVIEMLLEQTAQKFPSFLIPQFGLLRPLKSNKTLPVWSSIYSTT